MELSYKKLSSIFATLVFLIAFCAVMFAPSFAEALSSIPSTPGFPSLPSIPGVVGGGGAACPTDGFVKDSSGLCIPSNTGLPGSNVVIPGSYAIIAILIVIMRWLLGIFGILAIIAFVISGLMYLFSGGDEARATSARKTMIYAIIGVIVGMGGVVIVNLIQFFLSAGLPGFGLI